MCIVSFCFIFFYQPFILYFMFTFKDFVLLIIVTVIIANEEIIMMLFCHNLGSFKVSELCQVSARQDAASAGDWFR